MPHLIIAHSANAPLDQVGPRLLSELVDTLAQVQTFPVDSLKCRLQRAEIFQVATGRTQSFIHAELSLLSGRDVSVRQQIGQAIADVLVRYAPASDCQLSVEVREMDRSTYVKRGDAAAPSSAS